jgi:hypothetical protein
MRNNQAAMCSIALLLAVFAASCSSEPTPTLSTSGTGGTGGVGGAGGMATSSSTGSTGGGGAGGAGGVGGAGGEPMSGVRRGTETVSGGQHMKSSSYSLVYTVGQPTQIQTTTKSSSYQMQGGLIGANGSLP